MPSVQPLLNLWPTPSGRRSGFQRNFAEVFSSPLQTIREDFGTAALDHIFSQRDSLAGVYTIDDGGDVTATLADPYSTDILNLREQVLQPRGNAHFLALAAEHRARSAIRAPATTLPGEPTPGTPAATFRDFCWAIRWARSWSAAARRRIRKRRSAWRAATTAATCTIARNLYTYEDRVTLTRGRHQFSFGAWFQQFQSNETLALSQFGQATFASLTTFLQGTTSTFLYDPAPTEMNWRSLFGAWYAEDVIRVTPKLTLSLGFRDEFSTGWNEAHGRAANYTFTDGVISTQPHVGSFALHHEQRQVSAAAAHRPGLESVRAQRPCFAPALGCTTICRTRSAIAPIRTRRSIPTYSIAALPVSNLPDRSRSARAGGAKLVPGGVQPDMKTPTLISWSLRVRAGAFSQHVADHRLCGIARLPRNHRPRCQRADSQ